MVGHTHEDVDQRFTVISQHIATMNVLSLTGKDTNRIINLLLYGKVAMVVIYDS